MHKALRAFLATIVALVSVPAYAWLAAELAAYYEMFSTGMKSRAELGDDLGFGILLFMVVPLFTLAGALLVWGSFGFVRGARKPLSLTGIPMHNMAVDLAPFGRWALRNKAAQRRSPLCSAEGERR